MEKLRMDVNFSFLTTFVMVFCPHNFLEKEMAMGRPLLEIKNCRKNRIRSSRLLIVLAEVFCVPGP